MGLNFSSPFGLHCNFLENGLQSIHQEEDGLQQPSQRHPSIPLVRASSEVQQCPKLQPSSISSLHRSGSLTDQEMPSSPVFHCGSSSPKHEAAIKLQKVYKSFRTRRKLADCAVLVEQSWLKLLDFAELKHSSISFFDIEKHETAISRWSRARTRAAKVGKGLSKNGKAQKLALQHWLEAIDPRHRYGHNLHFYYVNWLNSQSKEPFFYWLDIGEGKEVNLVEKCPRLKLQQQCIKYLGPMERKAYEIRVEDGKLFYKESGELLDTSSKHVDSKWIFVLSTSRTLYVGKKKKGSFQHSSFLSGGATLAAGRIVAEKGVLKAVWPHSGHYRPTPENFEDFISFLRENDIDLSDVKLDSIDDDDKSLGKHVRNNSSEDDLILKDHLGHEGANDTMDSIFEKITSREEHVAPNDHQSKLRAPQSFRKLIALQIPSKDNLVDRLRDEEEVLGSRNNSGVFLLDSPLGKAETEQEDPSTTTTTAQQDTAFEEQDNEAITEDSILQRINLHKGTKSYQLGKHLSCRWSTGAGPRIGCVRDYPSGLQSHALEQVSLSPRSKLRTRFNFLSRSSTSDSSNLSHMIAHSAHL